MPRRVPDYPDAFEGWNYVSSIGSLISVVSIGLFIYILYCMLSSTQLALSNPWGLPEYFISTPSYEEESKGSTTLEWGLPTPTPIHCFPVLPIQS